MRRFTITTLLAAFALLFFQQADAQSLRAPRTFYVSPNLGVANYIGDLDETPTDIDDADNSGFPYSLGMEVGYNTSDRFSVGGSYRISNFPTIDNEGSDFPRRHMASLVLRYTTSNEARLAPFIQTGLVGVAGETVAENGESEDKIGIGPWAGVGLDYVVSPNASLFLGLNSRMIVPDDAADGVGADDDTALERFDLLSDFNFGINYRFKSAY